MKKFSKYNTTILIRPQSGMYYNAVYDKFVFMKSQAYGEMCVGNIENMRNIIPSLMSNYSI